MRERNHWYEKLIGRPEELEDDLDLDMDERERDRAAMQDAQRRRYDSNARNIRTVFDLRQYS